jgi:hypothetical protein
MKWVKFIFCSCAVASAAPLSSAWIQLDEGARSIIRIVVPAQEACPAVQVDGATKSMDIRRPIPAGFPPLCELRIAQGAKQAVVNGQKLRFPKPNPTKIVAFGDTGCRIKGAQLQDCNNPEKWPFERVAGATVATKPDLFLHVGDYLYREDPCPPGKEAMCGGTPHGDNWDTWNADFFKPARKLLESVPLVLARGNHEDCTRAWRGWGYYLDTHPWTGVCQLTPPPVRVELGKFRVVVFDSTALNDNRTDPALVQNYAAQLASVKTEHALLLDHHPFWALRGTAGNPTAPETETLEQAWDKGAPKGIDLVVSGHTHTFEILGFGGMRPVQIVAGNGGTALEERLPPRITGVEIHGFQAIAGQTDRVFGYTTLTKTSKGWDVVLRNVAGKKLANCAVQGFNATCKSPDSRASD